MHSVRDSSQDKSTGNAVNKDVVMSKRVKISVPVEGCFDVIDNQLEKSAEVG